VTWWWPVPELPIVVVGMPGPTVEADLVVGGRRHLEGRPGRHLVIGGDVGRVLDAIAAEPRLTATGLQTVGVKGWDGLVLALVG
jgi:hypothetical protein